MLSLPFYLLLALPSLAVMLTARFFTARALGMKGVRFFLGGRVEDPARATPIRRAAVVAAALAASDLALSILFTIARLLVGTPVFTNEIAVLPGKPAEAAGLVTGDRVTAVAGKRTALFAEIAAEIKAHAGEPIEIIADRGGQDLRFTVTPEGSPGQGKIGISAGRPRRDPAGVGAAIGEGLAQPAGVIADMARGIVLLVKGSPAEMTGPVGIVAETSKAAESSLGETLRLLAAMCAYAWPLTALIAIAGVPLPRREPRAKR